MHGMLFAHAPHPSPSIVFVPKMIDGPFLLLLMMVMMSCQPSHASPAMPILININILLMFTYMLFVWQ